MTVKGGTEIAQKPENWSKEGKIFWNLCQVSFCICRNTTENNQLALTQFKLAKPEAAPPRPPAGPALEPLDGDAVRPDPDKKVKRWRGSGGSAVRWDPRRT